MKKWAIAFMFVVGLGLFVVVGCNKEESLATSEEIPQILENSQNFSMTENANPETGKLGWYWVGEVDLKAYCKRQGGTAVNISYGPYGWKCRIMNTSIYPWDFKLGQYYYKGINVEKACSQQFGWGLDAEPNWGYSYQWGCRRWGWY